MVSNNKKNEYNPPSNEFFKNQIVEDETLLTKKEIAKFLNVSVKMIDRRVSLNKIPHLKIGSLVRFSKKRIIAWAEEKNSSR